MDAKYLSAAQQFAGDDHALNFARPFTNGAEFHIAVVLLRRVVLDEPVAAVNLHGFVRGPDGHFAGVELGHRTLPCYRTPAVGEARRTISQQACGVDLGRHVGQLEPDGLEIRDRLAKLLSLFRIADARFVGALGHSDCQRRDGDATFVQHLQAVDETFTGLPKAVFFGNAQSSKITSAVSLARSPSLFSFLPGRKPGAPRSMMKAEMPCLCAVLSVTAIATQMSAYVPFDVNVF